MIFLGGNAFRKIYSQRLPAIKCNKINFKFKYQDVPKCLNKKYHTSENLLSKDAECVLKQINLAAVEPSKNKITVVGAGNVGLASAFSCILENVTDELALIDLNRNKLKGEVMDLQHGNQFTPRVKVYGDVDFSASANSKICVITAGAKQAPGEHRDALLNANLKLFKNIIPQIVKYSPNVIILVVTNPVDVLSYAAWKISGLPLHKVIGSGTHLDTARLRVYFTERYKVNIQSVHVWAIGEHGECTVPVWSSLTVGGAIIAPAPNDDLYHKELHKRVVNSAYEIISTKGFTSWAIGLSVSDICKSIIHNSKNTHAVSVFGQGTYGITKEIYISLPCILDQNGVSHIVQLPLSISEKSAFNKAVDKLYNIQKKLIF